jgi:hypothetical protein
MVKTGNIRDLTQDELQKRNGQSSLSILGQSESVKGSRCRRKFQKWGRLDLNSGPVAAATALRIQPVEFIAASS